MIDISDFTPVDPTPDNTPTMFTTRDGQQISFTEMCQQAGIGTPHTQPTPFTPNPMNAAPTPPPIANGPTFTTTDHGVVVTDIFGGQHTFPTMEMANNCVDMFSGLPTHYDTNIPSTPSSASSPLPTNIHTPIDVSGFDSKIDDHTNKLTNAMNDLSHARNAQEAADASKAIDQAKRDIEFWKNQRAQSAAEQTVRNFKTDALINEGNKAINEFNDIMKKFND